jgi:hypothetical protein
LIETGKAAQSRGDSALAGEFFRAGQRLLEQLRTPKLGATQLELNAAAENWRQLFRGMTA